MSREYVIEGSFITDIHLLENNHFIDFARDLLHALQTDCTTVAQIVYDDNFAEAAVSFCLQQFNYCVRSDVASATCH